jgi:hypothetical protein
MRGAGRACALRRDHGVSPDMGLAGPVLPLVALLGLGPAGSDPADWMPPPAVDREPALASLHPRFASALARVAALAEEKLLHPGCREIFQDFHDAAGRPLERVLAETGRTPERLLASLAFVDGTASTACSSRTVLAWTHPGDRTIHICAMEFANAAHVTPRFTANLLIHEGLHALGLGENPPSSTAITERVATRCGY